MQTTTFMRELTETLTETMHITSQCPCCRQRYVADPHPQLSSFTLTHTEECELLELRRMFGSED